MVRSLIRCGIEVEMITTRSHRGQAEIDIGSARCCRWPSNLMLYKYVVKSVARRPARR